MSGNALWGMFPNETNREFIKRFLRSCAIGLVHSWITSWAAPWTNMVLAYVGVQYLVLIATIVNCSSLLSKLDVHRSKQDQRAFLARGMMIATILSACTWADTLFPFVRTHRDCMLINGFFLRRLAPAVCRWIDQQVSDAQSFADTGAAVAQLMFYLAPRWAILSCFLFGVAASILFLIWTSPTLQVAWWYVSNASSAVQSIIELYPTAFRTLVSSPRARVKQWQTVREQSSLRRLPRLKFNNWPPPKHREIRLLVLPRRRPFRGLECKIIKVSVDSAPEYEAISHAWEHPLYPMRVAVVSHKRTYQLKVSSRIYDFLNHHQSYFSSKLYGLTLCASTSRTWKRGLSRYEL